MRSAIPLLLLAGALAGCIAVPTHAKVGERPLPDRLTRLEPRWVDIEAGPGVVLRGVLFERPGPTVLVLSGSGMSAARNAALLESLYNAGYTVLNADYRGTGYSSGDWGSSATLDDDAVALWEWVRENRPGPAGVMGVSMGAVAGSALLTHPDPPEAVVFDRPVNPETVIYRFLAQHTRAGAIVSLALVRSSVDVDVLARLAGARAPTRLLLPEYDLLHPPEDVERMRAAANDHVEALVLPGGHLSTHLVDPVAWRRLFLDFFDDHLRPGKPALGGRSVPPDPARVAGYTRRGRRYRVELDRVPDSPFQLLLMAHKRVGLLRVPEPRRVVEFELGRIDAWKLGPLFGIRAVADDFGRPVGRLRLPAAP